MSNEVKYAIAASVVSSLLTATILSGVALAMDWGEHFIDDKLIADLAESEILASRVASKMPFTGDTLQRANATTTVPPRNDGSVGIPIPEGYTPIACQWRCTEGVAISVWRNEQDGNVWRFEAWNGHSTRESRLELTLLLLPVGQERS